MAESVGVCKQIFCRCITIIKYLLSFHFITFADMKYFRWMKIGNYLLFVELSSSYILIR
jgi:hypothetical protein